MKTKPTAAIAAGVALVAFTAAGCASTHPSHPAVSRPSSTAPASPPPAAAVPAAVVPSPDGTFQGSCDYSLGDSPATGTAQAIGDVDAVNTGNIGIVVKLTITWPQEGFAPLKLSKTVRVPQGGDVDMQFHRPLSGDQVDRLQSYQSGHGYDDGCTYRGEMTDTFGTAS